MAMPVSPNLTVWSRPPGTTTASVTTLCATHGDRGTGGAAAATAVAGRGAGIGRTSTRAAGVLHPATSASSGRTARTERRRVTRRV